MISKQEIEGFVNEVIDKYNDAFIVNISISSSNEIKVIVDSYETFSISNCIKLSKYIESKLNRDIEDYALEVSSAGLSESFLVIEQYKKNIGNDIEIITKEGKKLNATLLSVSNNGIEFEQEIKVSIDGKKKKQIINKKFKLDFDNIKSTKVIIKFK